VIHRTAGRSLDYVNKSELACEATSLNCEVEIETPPFLMTSQRFFGEEKLTITSSSS